MQWLTALFVGVGLSATCGFRVFVPLLGMGIACKLGHLEFAPGFGWMGSWPAIIALSVATAAEIAGYYIPWIDNLLDSIATPAAIAAGTLATASVMGDSTPFIRWALAIIAGGGAAGVVQGSSVLVRGASSASTGGLANPVLSTLELVAAIVGTILAILLPLVAMAIFAFVAYKMIKRFMRKRSTATA
ncbi:MAG: DUF4126 domain-containing protein [Victivallales bacterium]|nr:DUF4126 domain-containing protein [Victivallales bacterium]